MRILIVTEGGREIGFGHITRCLSLCDAFEERNIIPELIINADNSILGLLKGRKYSLYNWFKKQDRFFNEIDGAEVVIIDSYLAGLGFYQRVSDMAEVPVYIDDFRRLDYPKGIVINGSVSAQKTFYHKKKGIRYLLGTKYTPLRKPFWEMPNKRVNKHLSSILLTFGGNDRNNLAAKVLTVLINEYPRIKKYIVIGKGFRRIKELKRIKDKKTDFIYDPDAFCMRGLMLNSDLAISAGGQTLYELARIGVPAIGICVARNQLVNLRGWSGAGFIDYIGWDKTQGLSVRLKKSIHRLIIEERRFKSSKTGRALIDGQGARRVIDFIISNAAHSGNEKNDIGLRKASAVDCRDLWLWRNHSRVRRWVFHPRRIEYKRHVGWFKNKLKDIHSKIYIAQNKRKDKIGQIRFDLGGRLALVSVNLNPRFFGRGLGSKIIKKGTERFLKENRSVKIIKAEIINKNITSKKAFQKAGYLFSHTAFKNSKKTAIFALKRAIQ